MTQTVDEVYFLVRIGSWDQDALERWVSEQVDAALSDNDSDWQRELTETRDAAYREGFDEGFNTGLRELQDHARYLER